MASDIDMARREIARALIRKPRWRLRLRLIAIDAALSGQPMERAAALANVQRNTLRAWLGKITHDGIVKTLGSWEGRGSPLKITADASELRSLSADERNPRIRKRLLALACIADGLSVDDASAHSKLDRAQVYLWIKRFRPGGLEALSSA